MEQRAGWSAEASGRRWEAEPGEVDLVRVAALVAVGVCVMVAVLLGAWVARVAGEGSPRGPLSGNGLASVVERAAGVTVTVRSRGCDGASTGSGVVLEGRVVTNRHLTDGSDRLTVTGGPGAMESLVPSGGSVEGPVELPVVARAPGLDLARTGPGVAPGAGSLVVAQRDPAPGEPVLLGADYGAGFRHLEGVVVGVVEGASYGFGTPVLLVDVPTVPGFSGGPVLNRDGELVGLLAAVDTATDQSLAIPASELSAWLASADDSQADTSCIGGSS